MEKLKLNSEETKELQKNFSEAVEKAMEAEAPAKLDTTDIHQVIKNSFESTGFTCTDCYDGDIHNGMVMTMKNTKIALVWTDGEITKQNIVDAQRLKKRLKYKSCAVLTCSSNSADQYATVLKAGARVVRKMKQKDDKLNLITQMFFLA